jgi:hypothetical protein
MSTNKATPHVESITEWCAKEDTHIDYYINHVAAEPVELRAQHPSNLG